MTPNASDGKVATAGAVQFTLDGERAGEPVRLDSNGRATWKTTRLRVGSHRVAASYVADRGSAFLSSTSRDESHTVREKSGDGALDSGPRPDHVVAPALQVTPARPNQIKRPNR